MSLTTFGWLVLIFPLAGATIIGLTFQLLPQRVHGVIGTLAIFLAFLSAIGMLIKLGDRGEAWPQPYYAGRDQLYRISGSAEPVPTAV